MVEEKRGVIPYLQYLVIGGILSVPRVLPYHWRVPLIGWLTAHLVAPLAGYRKRIRENLALIHPDMDPDEVRRLERAVPNNAGRLLAEMWSQEEFVARIRETPMTGPGVAHLEAAKAAGRPIIGVSGHFGNYDTLRSATTQAGHFCAGLYRPMANAYFNELYSKNLEALAGPAFPQSRRGLVHMLKHVRAGNMLAILVDQRDDDGACLSFFGKPALTALSAAEIALKHDALFIPAYGIRKDNGLDFEIRIEDPIPHSDPETMMQAFNDSLEAMVRKHPEQWLWVHRRWKMPNATEPSP